MTNKNRSKGNRTKRRAIEYYENDGWLVDTVELTGRFIKSKDLFSDDSFGGFDIVCLKPNKLKMVQLKTNTPPTQEPYKQFAKKYSGKNIHVEVFTWYDRKGPRIQRYLKNGRIIEKDLRK